MHRCQEIFSTYGETDIKPTRSGLAFRIREWDIMKKIMEEINDKFPSLGTALPCYLSEDHMNQLGALNCRECYPFATELF